MQSSPQNNNPLVSICIPTFNAEKYIKKTINSIVNQSYKNIEIIILDDCSTDSTMKIIRSIDDPRIKIFQNEFNLGPQETWSKLIDLAEGRFFKIVCHDDVLYEECVAVQVKMLEENGQVILVASNRDIIDKNDTVVFSPDRFRQDNRVSGRKLLRSCLRKGTNIIGEPHAVMFRMCVIRRESIKFSDNFYLIDLEFYSEVLLYGDAFLISRKLSAFRVYKEAGSYRLLMNQSEGFIKFVEKLKKRGDYTISFFDFFLAKTMSLGNQLGRILFYRLL
ncbi:glycosyltransferase family 2 protein [Porticoccus hydrocarbonoclasticus]|uniref:glycosyltransferase family 2 protein n=1 Tax=Porticoccus hydrocarbonoclasticus TaxID=1073414 RepID=UPI0023563F95|nr:glycosyltransferase family 2 protein [Porticoccus hydrocarbonoclasticus]|tara:strand:+ start:6683 stop:7513 length:831 start_codon:yes stop_codon:yes gene_type:complete